MSFKSSYKRYKKSRAEAKGYRQIVAKKTTLAARQAYADEAVKVAAERARAKARRPSVLSSLGTFAFEGVRRVASGKPRAKVSSKRRATRRVVRSPTRKSYSRSKRSYAPVRRVARRRVVRKVVTQDQPRSPATLNEAIYGGY